MVPNDAYPIIRYRKSDRIGGYYDHDDNGIASTAFPKADDRSYIDIYIAAQALTTAGNVSMEINFYDPTGVRLSSFSWAMKVEASTLSDHEIVSSDYYNALTDLAAAVIKAGNNLPDDIGSFVSQWLEANVHVTSGVVIDPSLTMSGQAADAYSAGHVIKISDTKPSEAYNRVWFKDTVDEVEIPTMAEFSELVARVEALEH